MTARNNPTPANNINVALDLARQGFHVFPCHSSGERSKEKSPLGVYSWTKECTTDTIQIQKWWSRYPHAAVGLALGKSNLIVVDADRHDPKADGVEAFGALMAAHNYAPHNVPVAVTPNAGTHFFYRQKAGETHGNSEGNLPDGINIRGSGGYVIAPGTIMQDGRFYEPFGSIKDAPEIPDWLWEIIRTQKQIAPQSTPVSHDYTRYAPRETGLDELADLLGYIPPDCPYQEWVDCLMAIHAETGGSPAGFNLINDWSSGGQKYPGTANLQKKWASFKSSGISKNTLAHIARGHGADLSRIAINHRPKPDPVKQDEDRRIANTIRENILKRRVTEAVNDIETAEENQGGAVEYFDLPEGMLNPGGVVGEIADWICDWTSEPIRIHAIGAALVIVGNLVARKVYSKTRPTGTALYIGITAPSGMGKQHPQDAMRLALDQATSACAHTGWNVSLPSIIRALFNKAATVMIADEFADKLIGIRNQNANASQLSISEGLRTLWGATAGAYSPDAALSRQDTTIQRPCLSFFGASTQKDFSRSLVSKDITNGLFNRFLILPRFEEVRTTAEPDALMTLPESLKSKLSWLYNCLGDQLQTALAERADGFPSNPILVPFTDDAKAMDEANKVHQKAMQRASEDDEALALYGRYAEQIKRVALIVACGRQPKDVQSVSITKQDMTFAKMLVEYSIMQFVLMVRRDMVENRIEADRKKVLGVIRKKKNITRSQLLRKIRSISARDMRDIISILCEANQIVETKVPSRTNVAVIYRYLQG